MQKKLKFVNLLYLLKLTLLIQISGIIKQIECNTEQYFFKNPLNLSVEDRRESFLKTNNQILNINSTHYLIDDHEVNFYGVKKTKLKQKKVTIEYNTLDADYDKKTVMVKMDFKNSRQLKINDNIHVKICYPAIYAYRFKITHEILNNNFHKVEGNEIKNLNVYILIDIYFIGQTYDSNKFLSQTDTLKFYLQISKLGKFSIPYELIDIILYVIDCSIIILMIIVPGIFYLESI